MKILKSNYQAKTSFIVLSQVKELVTKYKHVLKVWKKFEIKRMIDYQDLYLKCDILLLAGVFEKFRNNSLRNYGLCPIHYLIAPALSWDAILNKKKVKLELIPDPDV